MNAFCTDLPGIIFDGCFNVLLYLLVSSYFTPHLVLITFVIAGFTSYWPVPVIILIVSSFVLSWFYRHLWFCLCTVLVLSFRPEWACFAFKHGCFVCLFAVQFLELFVTAIFFCFMSVFIYLIACILPCSAFGSSDYLSQIKLSSLKFRHV